MCVSWRVFDNSQGRVSTWLVSSVITLSKSTVSHHFNYAFCIPYTIVVWLLVYAQDMMPMFAILTNRLSF